MGQKSRHIKSHKANVTTAVPQMTVYSFAANTLTMKYGGQQLFNVVGSYASAYVANQLSGTKADQFWCEVEQAVFSYS